MMEIRISDLNNEVNVYNDSGVVINTGTLVILYSHCFVIDTAESSYTYEYDRGYYYDLVTNISNGSDEGFEQDNLVVSGGAKPSWRDRFGSM